MGLILTSILLGLLVLSAILVMLGALDTGLAVVACVLALFGQIWTVYDFFMVY